jgi:hypothetical protein
MSVIVKCSEQSAQNAQRCVAYLKSVGLIRSSNRFCASILIPPIKKLPCRKRLLHRSPLYR